MESNRKYFVFRINYKKRKELLSEAQNGRLRQGWSIMEPNKKGIDVANDYDEYLSAWKQHWEDDEKYIRNKYNQLQKITKIEEGDIIVVPKLPDDDKYTIFEATGKYYFDKSPEVWSGEYDFRSCIGVKTLGAYNYARDNNSRIVSNKFRAYRSAINMVWNNDFIDALEGNIGCIERGVKNLDQPEDNIEILRDLSDKVLENVSDELFRDVSKWNPEILEEIVKKLFQENGYEVIDIKKYNGSGGDYDMVFQVPQKGIFYDILDSISYNEKYDCEIKLPLIGVQVKSKSGVDRNDIEGVKQLIKMKSDYPTDYQMLITTADEISSEALSEANKNNIIIIDKLLLTKLLIKYSPLVFGDN